MGISNKVLVHVKQCPNCVHQSKTCTLACYSYVFWLCLYLQDAIIRWYSS